MRIDAGEAKSETSTGISAVVVGAAVASWAPIQLGPSAPLRQFAPMHKPSIDETEDSADVLHVLLGACARKLVADDDAQAFSDWFVEAVPRLAPALIAQAIEPDQFARVLARAIYRITPLPSNAYAPRRLPAPGRNEPCFCGSGRKYKHCCKGKGRRRYSSRRTIRRGESHRPHRT